MNVSQEFAAHIQKTKFDSIPREIIDRAKWRLADSVGVFAAGAKGKGIDAALELVKRWGGAGESSIYNFGGKVPAHNAAWINSLMLRSFDFECIDAEDIDCTWPAHVTGTTVPTVLALGEFLKKSGKDILTALCIGDDIVCRMIAASKFDVFGNFDSNGTSNSIGATAIASKLLGLNPEQIVDAFGIDVNACSGTMANTKGYWTFKLPIANSARSAIIAAEFAQAGYHGLPEPLTGDRCFFDMFAPGYDTTNLTKDLGTKFFSDVVIKPWACCRGTHAPLDAMMSATNGKIYKASEIEKIIVGAPHIVTGFVGRPFEFGTTEESDALFSLRYTTVSCILRGNVTPAHYAPEMMTDPQVGDLLNKLEIVEWNPDTKGGKFGAFVEVTLKDGTILRGENGQNIILGDIRKKPMTEQAIYDKMVANVEFGGEVSLENVKKAFDMALNLDKVDNIVSFIKLLVP